MFWVWLYLVVFALFDLIFVTLAIEMFAAKVRREAPEVPSSAHLRAAVISEIRKHYSDAKTVLDIGSCYGGMARIIARNFPKMRVLGTERMPLPFTFSKIARIFWREKNVNFRFGDAFRFIKKSDGYDIGTAYLLTPMMPRVESVADKFRVLLVLDFPLPNRRPTRKFKLHKDLLGQHWLYVYENKV
ncbi:MAG: hypothetical protein FWC61_04575 [Proteobacteria bacterium]|nr:hypothetical protein [Pseudomonadota bacterium]